MGLRSLATRRPPMILPDYHLHTHYCGHAEGSVEDMVQQAIRLGLNEIAFVEHFPYPPGFAIDVPDCVTPQARWPLYQREVRQAQAHYGDRLRIRLGAEIDYIPGYEAEIGHRLTEMAPDVVFGSVHLIDGIVIDYQQGYLEARLDRLGGHEGLWRLYWDRMEALIQSALCDVVAHFDLPKKLGLGFPALLDWERIADLLDSMAERGLTLELNTGGIDRSVVKEPYPTERILRMAYDREIDVLLGSDAHRPTEIARYFQEATQILRSVGYRRVVTFAARRKRYLPLP